MTFCLELHILVYLLKWPCLLPQALLFSLNANTRMIALQCCVDFCHTSAWVSHRFTHVPSLLPPACHPIPSISVVTEHWTELPVSYSKFPPAVYFTWGNVCSNTTLSTRPTLSFPHCALCLHLYYCPTNINRFIGTIFLDTIYMCPYTTFVFLFLTYFTLYNRLQVHSSH